MSLIVALFILAFTTCNGARISDCPRASVKYEKVIGLRPSSGFQPLLLLEDKYASRPLTLDCLRKCSENDQCLSFVLFYKNSTCFWYRNEIHKLQEDESVLDSEVAWFVKTCLQERGRCQNLWTFERVPGAALIGNDTRKLPQVMSRHECEQNCLNETSFECRSAKFKVHTINSVTTNFYNNRQANSAETLGSCVLSNSDRHLMPSSYRASSYDEEYFDNQCSSEIVNTFCTYEEYVDVVLNHADSGYNNRTKMQCQDLCDSNRFYKCRGYSLVPMSRMVMRNPVYYCLLHSENSKLHGPKSLQDHPGAMYYEKAPCLNIDVACTQKLMTVTFQPDMFFNGRLYMKGYSENPECYARGSRTNKVTLRIPLEMHKCGILQAESPGNRTLMSSTMILQYNSLVQTQADRIIKVGCIFTNDTKIVVGVGFNFTDNDHQSSGSSLVNFTAVLPTVEMRIVDLNTRGEVSDTQIGDELQLIIEMRPANGGLDIMAGHLIAMNENGQDSILLIDDRSCPTNLNVFPGLVKTVTNNVVRLTSTFQAFKFSSSNIIRFSVIVQFCVGQCPPVTCPPAQPPFRSKREFVAGTVEKMNISDDEEMARVKVVQKMPLEFVMIVRNANTKPDRLVYGENNKILVAGYDYMNDEVCIDYSLLLGIVITWILIQIILLVSCFILIKRYKQFYESQYLSESLEELHKNFGLGFSNLEPNRRVHFADGHLT